MRVLLCGSSGQLGLKLQQIAPKNVRLIAVNKKQLDITCAQKVADLVAKQQISLIINAAAMTDVEQAQINPKLAYAVNAEGAANLARQKVPLIHVSTDYVFGGDKGNYAEFDQTKPLNNYGLSKLAGEIAICRLNPQHIIVRTAWLFGAQGTNFVTKIIELAQNQDNLKVVIDEIGNPTSYYSLAKALWQIVFSYQKSKNLAWGIYHFAGDAPCSRYEFALKIVEQAYKLQILRHKPKIEFLLSNVNKAPRPQNSSLNCTLFEQTFNFKQPNWRRDLTKELLWDIMMRNTKALIKDTIKN